MFRQGTDCKSASRCISPKVVAGMHASRRGQTRPKVLSSPKGSRRVGLEEAAFESQSRQPQSRESLWVLKSLSDLSRIYDRY